MSSRKHNLFVWPLCLVLLAGCENSSQRQKLEQPPQTPTVAVVNPALKYFVERIAGDKVQIQEVMPLAEGDPKKWKPSSSAISELQKSDLIFLNGANFSKWLQTVSLPQGKLVDTSESFRDQIISVDSFVHRHGPKGNQSDKQTASLTWLDLSLAKLQAEAVYSALSELLPTAKQTLENNHEGLQQELTELDQAFQSACLEFAEVKILSSDPIYQYFARRYQLNIQSLPKSWSRDAKQTEPLSDQQKKELTGQLKSHPASLMIWPLDPAKSKSEELESEFQIQSLSIDPAQYPSSASDNWLETMRNNLERLKSAAQSH